MASKQRDYEAEFIQAFDDLNWNIVDCTAAGSYLAWHNDTDDTIMYQYKPEGLRYPVTHRLSQFTLDFCVPEALVALEFDGFFSADHGIGGHRNWGGFHRDRRKDRLLTMNDWRVLRYGPGDVRDFRAVIRAAEEFIALVRKVK
jgi:very-short-patch-repair endonuclease